MNECKHYYVPCECQPEPRITPAMLRRLARAFRDQYNLSTADFRSYVLEPWAARENRRAK